GVVCGEHPPAAEIVLNAGLPPRVVRRLAIRLDEVVRRNLTATGWRAAREAETERTGKTLRTADRLRECPARNRVRQVRASERQPVVVRRQHGRSDGEASLVDVVE